MGVCPITCWDTHIPGHTHTLDRHPQEHNPLDAHTPGKHPLPQNTTGYGQQAAGKHPTGMHSCWKMIFRFLQTQEITEGCSFLHKAFSFCTIVTEQKSRNNPFNSLLSLKATRRSLEESCDLVIRKTSELQTKNQKKPFCFTFPFFIMEFNPWVELVSVNSGCFSPSRFSHFQSNQSAQELAHKSAKQAHPWLYWSFRFMSLSYWFNSKGIFSKQRPKGVNANCRGGPRIWAGHYLVEDLWLSWGGINSQSGTILQNFTETAWKWKNLNPRGASLALPIGSANVTHQDEVPVSYFAKLMSPEELMKLKKYWLGKYSLHFFKQLLKENVSYETL